MDTAIYQGYTIPPYYDSMIAKLIVHGATREGAIARMRRVLEEFIVQGVETNLDLLYLIMLNPEFVEGNYNTGFIEKNLETLVK